MHEHNLGGTPRTQVEQVQQVRVTGDRGTTDECIEGVVAYCRRSGQARCSKDGNLDDAAGHLTSTQRR
jgi:hypothetical protein